MSSKPEILIYVSPGYKAPDGDAFDAVVAALNHFGIEALVTSKDALNKSPKSMEIHVQIKEDYVAADGDEFNAVVDALAFFEIPAYITQSSLSREVQVEGPTAG